MTRRPRVLNFGPPSRGVLHTAARCLFLRCVLACFIILTVIPGTGLVRAGAARARPAAADQPAPPPSRAAIAALSANVDRTDLTVVDTLTLTLQLRLPARDAATNQPFAANPILSPNPTAGQSLGDLLVSAVRRDPPQLDTDHLLHRWIVTLEPQLPGRVQIPAIGVTLAPAQTAASASPASTLLALPLTFTASDPIDLTITSVLDAAPNFIPGQVRPPLDPAPRPATPPTPPWLLPSAISFLAGGLGVLGLLSLHSTPRRRIRRAFAPLQTLARALVGSRHSTDDPAHALAAADLIRDASTLTLGPTARAATPDELATLLSPSGDSTPTTPTPAQITAITPLLTWADARRYGGLTTPPPPLPDLPSLIRNLEQAALNNLSQPPGARPA